MADVFGFSSLKRWRSLRGKKSFRGLLPSAPRDAETSTSVPSLVTSCNGSRETCNSGYASASVSTLPDVTDDYKFERNGGVDSSKIDSGIFLDKNRSSLSLVYGAASVKKSYLRRSFSSKRVSKSVASLSSQINPKPLIRNEHLATSTQAVSDALEKEVSKEKQMSIGRKKFNIDPKKGIEYLIENGLLTHNPKDIAQFLLTGEGLNKSQIGNYLGEYRDLNQQVYTEFINLQDFTDMGILQALRQFLWTLHPPGEAQKLDRMLEGFSRRYCQLNSTAFPSSSGCFILAFSIVILNTLLHNKNIKDKPSLKIFVEMVNNDQDLPVSLLEEIFESLKAEPFKKDDGDELMHTFFNPDREGWLWKQGGRYKSWKRRWFIMTGKCLYYFEYTTDKEFKGIIPLENIKVREVEDRRMSNCFEIFSEGSNLVKACKTCNGKVVEGRHHVYRISATSKSEKEQWMDAIRKSTMFNPLYKLLSEVK